MSLTSAVINTNPVILIPGLTIDINQKQVGKHLRGESINEKILNEYREWTFLSKEHLERNKVFLKEIKQIWYFKKRYAYFGKLEFLPNCTAGKVNFLPFLFMAVSYGFKYSFQVRNGAYPTTIWTSPFTDDTGENIKTIVKELPQCFLYPGPENLKSGRKVSICKLACINSAVPLEIVELLLKGNTLLSNAFQKELSDEFSQDTLPWEEERLNAIQSLFEKLGFSRFKASVGVGDFGYKLKASSDNYVMCMPT